MIPTAKKTMEIVGQQGELRVGWASWDKGKLENKSIKYAYRDKRGWISRGSPEVPFDILTEMIIFAKEQGELSSNEITRIKLEFC